MRHNPECEALGKRGLRKTLRYPVSGFGKNLLNVRLTFCMLAVWNDGQADEGMRWLAQSAFRPGRMREEAADRRNGIAPARMDLELECGGNRT